jgi:hypothetical protein
MPSWANKADRSNGDDPNSVDVGDIRPKASADSTAMEGLRDVIANSVDRGDVTSVGVVASSSLCGNVGTVTTFRLISGRSGSITLSDGMRCPAGST